MDTEPVIIPGQNENGSEEKAGQIEVSIVIPCLNEVETVAKCVGKAVAWLNMRAIKGEVILSDNGSTDGSIGRASRSTGCSRRQ